MKEIMMEEEKKEDSKIMEEPIMEEDLVNINKQRNGKAAGVDGLKAEVMKHMIKNRSIKLHFLRSFNRCLHEMVNDDWS